MDREAIFLEPDHAIEPGESGRSIRRLVNPEDSQDRCVCRLEILAPGASLAGRTMAEEVLYAVAGSVLFVAEDRKLTLETGSSIRVSSRVAWSLENLGEKEAEIFVLSAFAGDAQTAAAALREREPFTYRAAGEGRTIGVVGDLYRFLATGDETNGRCAIWEGTVFPEGGPPTHFHQKEDEGFFVLEGEVEFKSPTGARRGGPGFFAYLPIGLPHSFMNPTERPARMLVFVAPGGLEKMFARAGKVFDTAPTKPVPPSDEELQRLHDLALEFGIEFIAAR